MHKNKNDINKGIMFYYSFCFNTNRQHALQNRIWLSDITNDPLNMDSHICYRSCLIHFHGRQLIISICDCGNVSLACIIPTDCVTSNTQCVITIPPGSNLSNTPHCSVRCLLLTYPPHGSEMHANS